MTGPGKCALDVAELRAQLGRYEELGRRAGRVERRPGRLLVHFDEEPPAALLNETLEVERRCCPFFTLDYRAEARRLEISVEDEARRDALTALALALAPAGVGTSPRVLPMSERASGT